MGGRYQALTPGKNPGWFGGTGCAEFQRGTGWTAVWELPLVLWPRTDLFSDVPGLALAQEEGRHCHAAAETASVWHEMVTAPPQDGVRTPCHEANSVFSCTAVGQQHTAD